MGVTFCNAKSSRQRLTLWSGSGAIMTNPNTSCNIDLIQLWEDERGCNTQEEAIEKACNV